MRRSLVRPYVRAFAIAAAIAASSPARAISNLKRYEPRHPSS